MELVSRISSPKSKKNSNLYECATISDIPDDFLIKVLLRLPWKTAKQCMLVSKHWYALMTTPYFTHRFLEMNYAFSLLMYYLGEDGIKRLSVASSENSILRSEAFSFSYLPCEPQAVAEPVAFCRDLVLCCAVIDSKCVYYLCNPLSKRWIQVPACPTPYVESWSRRHGFICHGGGATFRYAVIQIQGVYYGDSCLTKDLKVQIYNSDSGCWREKIFRVNYYIVDYFSFFGFQSKEMLFWESSHASRSHVIGIDPFSEDESYRIIELPPRTAVDYFECRILGVCKGNLRLLEIGGILFDRDVLSIRVWDLTDDDDDDGNAEWHMEYNISFSGLFELYKDTWFTRDYMVIPLTCDPNNGEIVYLLTGTTTIVSCNLHKQTLDVIFEWDLFPDFDDLGSALKSAIIYELPWLPTPLPLQNI